MSKSKKIEGYKQLAVSTVMMDASPVRKDEILRMIENQVGSEWKTGELNYFENRAIVEVIFNCRTEILKQKAALRKAIAA